MPNSTIDQNRESKNPLDNLSLTLTILFLSIILSVIKNLAPHKFIASWDIISYLILLLPLMQMIYIKQIENPFAKWIIPFILVLIVDTFYYNNALVVDFLPLVIYMMIAMLYLGSMQKMDYLFQVFIPKLNHSIGIFGAIGIILKPILSIRKYQQEIIKNTLYMRIGIALIITLPVMGVFLALFMAADPNFSNFIENLFAFKNPFYAHHAFTVPLLFLFFLVLFSYAISNNGSRVINLETNPFDPLIIGIFLGMLNFLFVTFLLFQLAYIFGGESYIKETGILVAHYAREGFFQLATVMSIVIIIFLIVIYRYKNEKLIALFMSGLMLQTMVMGYASLQKMYLYQSIKGATVLRYYVEWFDYFLLLILMMGILYLFTKRPFYQMLNVVSILAVIAFTIIASFNIDGMVAKHNIKQFASQPLQLDRELLSNLSIDILPYIQGSDIKVNIWSYERRDCEKFNNYHLGYCSKLESYGDEHVDFISHKNRRDKKVTNR